MRFSRPFSTRTGLAVGASVVVLIAAGGAAIAVGADDTVYIACKLNSTGTIRIIDPSLPSSTLLSRCTAYETKISWNQRGPTGATGLTGAKGDKGDVGDPGAPGATGLQGDKGDVGDPGAPGATGDKGDKGDKGDVGAPGPQGVPGPASPIPPKPSLLSYTRSASSRGSDASVSCFEGDTATGGGGYGTSGFSGGRTSIQESRPLVEGGGWYVRTDTAFVIDPQTVAYVVCVRLLT